MCCDGHDDIDGLMPHAVQFMLGDYRSRLEEVGFDWGKELADGPQMFELARYADFMELSAAVLGAGGALDPYGALWRVTAAAPPLGLAHLTLDESGASLRCPEVMRLIPGQPSTLGVLVRSELDHSAAVSIGAIDVIATPGEVTFVRVPVAHESPRLEIQMEANVAQPKVVEPSEAATLQLRSSVPCRWSIVDDRGGAWFPSGALEKWDIDGVPFFHGCTHTIAVPASPLTVVAARGTEYRPQTFELDPAAGAIVEVDVDLEQIYDGPAAGWYGGDLHVHLNYGSDYVVTPSDAALMQAGEGLHLLNLVAANSQTSLIYDREAFEAFLGQDLPWSRDGVVARWGVEYRNDLLGHFHALNPSAEPAQYNSGHARSDQPDDWPANAVPLAELRELGATVGYAHPVAFPLHADSSAAAFVGVIPQARELVADAALGLVDSIDLLQAHQDGTMFLYHRLLNTGIRLAATAGTDALLSVARMGSFSNPPGWARAYADLQGQPLSVEGWQDAIRNGRTFVTNGPWLELEVEGQGPGAVLDAAVGDELWITARCRGIDLETLSIVGPDGTVAEVPVTDEDGALTTKVTVTGPGWFAALVRGPGHGENPMLPNGMYAHTSPVHIEVAGNRIARLDDAAWCLEWLDHLERMIRTEGTYSTPERMQDVLDVVERGRDFYRSIQEAPS